MKSAAELMEQQLVFAELSGNVTKARLIRSTIKTNELVENSAILKPRDKKRFITQSKLRAENE